MAVKQFLSRMWNGKPEKRGTLDSPTQWMLDAFGGVTSNTGETVNATTAMRLSAVFACVRVLGETIASLPLQVYKRDGDDKRIDREHPVYKLLHDEPFPGLTSMNWRETLMAWCNLYGNAYAIIQRTQRGDIVGLQPWHPDSMKVSSGPTYTLKTSRGDVVLGADQVLHLKGLATDPAGLSGLSPISQARESVGLGIALEKFGAKFFSNGSRPGGVLEHPGVLEKEDAAALRQSWNEMFQGTDNSHKLVVLEDDMKFHALSVPNNDAQWLESRNFSVVDIARIYRVPPHLIGQLDRATYSNVEQQSTDFVVHTIRPWLVRWEQEFQRALFPNDDSRFAEFSVDGLLRGDTTARNAAYTAGRNWGWLSANDVRRLENLNAIEGGDAYLQPLNMVSADSASNPATPTDNRSGEARCACGQPHASGAVEKRVVRGATRRRLRNAWRPAIAAAFKRVVRAEIREIRKAKAGGIEPAAFRESLDLFYRGEFPALFKNATAGVLAEFSESVVEAAADETGNIANIEAVDITQQLAEYEAALESRHAAKSVGELSAILATGDPDADMDALIDERLDKWEAERSDQDAVRESVQMSDFVAIAAMGTWGITLYRWQANAGACPLCQELDGRVVGRDSIFIPSGGAVDPKDGVTSPLTATSNVGHAPLHGGCDCMVVAN